MRQPTAEEAMAISNAYEELARCFALVDHPDFSGGIQSQAFKYKRRADFWRARAVSIVQEEALQSKPAESSQSD